MRAILFAALLALTSSLACSAMPGGKSQQKSAPVVQAISPTAASVGASNVTLSVSGQNFNKRAALLWNGRKLNSYRTSTGLIQATLTQTELSAPGSVQVVVQNPSGDQSDPAAFTVSQTSVAPTVTSSTGTPTPTTTSSSDTATSTSKTTTTTIAPVVIVNSSLPQAVMASAYSTTVIASGGTTPYSFSLASGTLPAGLNLSTNGALWGTPSQSGTFSFTAKVTDAASQTTTKALSLSVAAAPAPAPVPPSIITSSLASGTVGSAYTATVSASGGTTPYSFSLASGTLPAGVNLATNGALAGSPSQSGTFSFTVKVTDAASQTATKFLSISVAGAAPVTGNNPSPQAGDTIVFQDDFEGGNLSKWDEAPARYAIESNTSNVHGGRYSVRGTINSGYNNGQLNKWYMPGFDEVYVKFEVMFSPGFADGGMHMAGIMGNNVNNKWSASGQAGIRPNGTDYFYVGADPEYPSMNGGVTTLYPMMFYSYWPQMSCPSNYDAVSNQNCWGNYGVQNTPKVVNTAGVWHEVVVHVKLNTVGQSDGMQEMWVDGQKNISQTGMLFRTTTDVRLNQFSWQLYTPQSPQLEYVWLDDVTVWTPGATTVQPVTSNSTTSTTTTATTPVAITTTSLSGATVGSSYYASLAASGGATPYTWSMPSGSLPSGMVLSATTGQLSGTPTATGNFTFAAQVNDADGQTANKQFSLSVQANPPAIMTSNMPSGTANISYAASLAASGGAAPYSWTLQGGSLPPGVAMNGSTGAIAGTPTSAGTYSFTAQVSDSLGQSSNRALSVAVSSPITGAPPIFSQDFESCSIQRVGTGGAWYDIGGPTGGPWINDTRNGGVARSGSCSAQAYGGPDGLNTGFALLEPPLFSQREIWMREFIRLSPDWVNTNCGSSCAPHFLRIQPQLTGGWGIILDASAGGDNLHWDNSFMGTGCGGPGNPTTSQGGVCDAHIPFSMTASKGQWVCWEVHVKLNSGTNSDGMLEFYNNGQLLYSKTGLKYNDNANPIDTVNYISNVGGGNAGAWPRSNYVNLDDVAWGTSRVGCN
jgi:Putative Ig domain/Polysaccharide lyase 14